jgi:hypothetical protein
LRKRARPSTNSRGGPTARSWPSPAATSTSPLSTTPTSTPSAPTARASAR